MTKFFSVLLAFTLALGVCTVPLVSENSRVEAASVKGVTKTVKLGWGKEVIYLDSNVTRLAKISINAEMQKVGSKSRDMEIDAIPGLSFIWNTGLKNAKSIINISANTFLYFINKADKGRGVIIYVWNDVPYSSKSQ